MRTAPPAVDRIVPAEVCLVRENSLAEFGEPQPAAQVGGIAATEILPGERAKLVIEARYRRPRTVRQPFKQAFYFRGVEHTPLT